MNSEKTFKQSLSMLGVWAFSVGTSVGWGSLVVTSSTYLAQAGPLGSVIGLLIGALVMLIISRNYSYMISCYPESGGSYSYAREVFGYDQGFLIAWFLMITYFAMLWANATSLPLFSRIFLGGVFSFGKMYSLFGYDVYFGEMLLTLSAIVIIGLLCMKTRKWADRIMMGLALVFTAGIIIAFLGAMISDHASMSPMFLEDSSALSQIIQIAVISPWAFIGFESISHRAEEFSFPHTKIHKVLVISVISTVALYILVTLLSVTAYPPQFSNWVDYIGHLGELSGIEALPAFYAANAYLGNFGVWLLMASLLSLVVTSLIGNITSLSRLFYALGKDQILPASIGELDENGVPVRGIMAVLAMSLFIPFVGRTAIGWIVDVTTIGAVLIYGFVSAGTAVLAARKGDKREIWTGRIGLVAMVVLGVYFLFPNLVTKGSLASETYLLFIVWSILGFVFFRNILHRDKKKRFGSSISVWIVLLALVLLVSFIWIRQSMISSYDNTMAAVQDYYENEENAGNERTADEAFISTQMNDLEVTNTRTIIIAIGMFGFALIIMMTNHSYMSNRSRENEKLANRDPMTGVMSKHAYLVREKEIDQEIQSGELKDFGVVVCDVNGLKKINDTLGHKAGDEYIRKACTMVCDIFQHSPIYRIGGDEFVALLTGRDYYIRKELLTKLHDLSVDHISENEAVVSGGLSVYDPAKDHSLHDIFQRADERMYEEKKLLKSLGAVTRDDESDNVEAELTKLVLEKPVINIRRHLLIVDDEDINRELLGNVLCDQFEILYASDGEEALSILREMKDEIALVLLDLMMPVLDGKGVLTTMHDDPNLNAIPVIVLTSDQEAEVECLKLGAMDFIPKPYPIWEIVKARVNKAIELSENRGIIQSTERDSLTKLFNIDYFMRYVNMFDQHFPDMPMDAVILDVNHFHMINERYGKSYGDSVLRRIGERLRQIAREIGGVGCRQGADSFLIYCPHQQDYTAILERAAEKAGGEENTGNRVRLRMGVYENVDKRLDIERRFDRARLAANTVKNNFVKAIGIYDDEMGQQDLYNERLLEDFHSAIENSEFQVYYQPKFDIRPDKPILASAEALVRWNHHELGMISPGRFIPLLEDNGMILELDTFVWQTTAAQIRKWKDQFGFSVPVSVNVSRIDMLMPNLMEIFQKILDDNQLTSSDIILEITESAYTGDSEQVISTARELRGLGMGFRIEMDDFGTGYSSLGMLTNLPIDALKLDMTFVRNAFGENKDVRMIELIIDIADYLHVPVVAEGVETEEQYLVLKAMGCDIVQGYYFSRPVPEEKFEEFLAARKGQSVEVTKSVKKTYMSISKALTGNFENIYYVDTLTDFYLAFGTGHDGELQIRPGGQDFFHDIYVKLIDSVVVEDKEFLQNALRKDNLSKWIGQEDAKPVIFHRRKDGVIKEYRLQTIRTRNSDDHHIVIGISEWE